MATTHGRWAAVLGTNAKGRTGTGEIAVTIPAGPSASATLESAIARVVTPSRGTYTCRAGQSANLLGTAIESTPYEAQSPALWPPLARSEWSAVVTCETMTEARLIHVPATFGTSVNKG